MQVFDHDIGKVFLKSRDVSLYARRMGRFLSAFVFAEGIFLLFFAPSNSGEQKFIVTTAFLLFLAIFAALSGWFFKWGFEKMIGPEKIILEEGRLLRQFPPGREQSVRWEEISSIHVKESSSGDILSMRLRTKKRIGVHLELVDDIQLLLRNVVERCTGQIQVSRKRGVNLYSNTILGPTVILFFLIFNGFLASIVYL